MAEPIGVLVAYIDNGRGKHFPKKIGAMWEGKRPDTFRIQIDMLPTHGWDGWINVFPWEDQDSMESDKEREEDTREAARKIAERHLKRPQPTSEYDDDDIPF